jgi:hypothetical protein
MNKINGTYKFKTVVTSQMIVTVSHVRRNKSSSILEFLIKIWLLDGDRIVQSIPVQTIEYEGRTVEGIGRNNLGLWWYTTNPAVAIVLSDKNILISHQWVEENEEWEPGNGLDQGLKYETAVIFLEINGTKIINKGYKIRTEKNAFGVPEYPIFAGRINNETGFLILPEQSIILSIAGGTLETTTTTLNTPLVKTTVHYPNWGDYFGNQLRVTSSRLSADTIIVFYHYSLAFNMQICVQVVKISETNNFTVSSMQFLPGRAEGTGMYYSTAIGSSRISDNECFFSYDVVPGIKKVGRIVTVNGNSVAWGSEVELINSNEIRVPGFVDLLGCQILSFSNSNNFIVVYLRRRGHEGVLIMELLAQSVKIQGSTISPQNIITIAESNDMDEIPWSSFIPLFKDIPTSSGSIFVIISSLRNPFYYKVLTMTGNDITASDKYMPEQDEHFFQIASDIYNWYYQKSSFGNTALIPPLKT